MGDKELSGLDLLRAPFEAGDINKLPKPYKADSPKGKCAECGGYHGLPAVHLDYVGHAALTKRLLDVDPGWTWEPVGLGGDGLPVFDQNGGLWIRLTICGVTRLGYGDAQGKKGGNAIKEAIGDALRNAGMRFGAALDLWHKGDFADAQIERGHEQAAKTAKQSEAVERIVARPEVGKPPTEWRTFVANAKTPDELQALYESDARHWFTDDVKAAFSAKKQELQSANA